ncbi:hypothetical protein ACU4GD_25915 [Cupriavidus basilensis]
MRAGRAQARLHLRRMVRLPSRASAGTRLHLHSRERRGRDAVALSPAGSRRRAPAPARETLRVVPAFYHQRWQRRRQWAEQGLEPGAALGNGIRRRRVARGSLVRVLAGWEFDSAPVTLLVPTRAWAYGWGAGRCCSSSREGLGK